MARRSRSGRRRGRGRGTVLTPKNIAVALPAIAGGVAAIQGAIQNHKFYNNNNLLDWHQPLGFVGVGVDGSGKPFLDKHAAALVVVPAIGGAIGSKAVKVGLNFVSKSLPSAGKKVLNAKIVRL